MSDTSVSSNLDNLPIFDAVLWSYRLFLGRDPENVEALSRHACSCSSFDEVRQSFLESEEFQAQILRPREGATPLDRALLKSFPPYIGPGADGFLTDFIGTRTRCAYWPDAYAGASGYVEGPPGTERFGLHDPAEWEGTLRSVLAAKSRFVAVELGAGWGPWLIASAVAAKRLGIKEIYLAGVEGAYSHYEFMLQHFQDNGFDPSAHLLLHAVAGARDGIARFPKLDVPRDNWGAEASYGEDLSSEHFEEVRSISVATLLSKLPQVDLLHCDVQGAESDVFSAGIKQLSARVRRIVVGTHSRGIEGQLMSLFGVNAWVLEYESPCRFVQDGMGALHLTTDGVQVWRNAGITDSD